MHRIIISINVSMNVFFSLNSLIITFPASYILFSDSFCENRKKSKLYAQGRSKVSHLNRCINFSFIPSAFKRNTLKWLHWLYSLNTAAVLPCETYLDINRKMSLPFLKAILWFYNGNFCLPVHSIIYFEIHWERWKFDQLQVAVHFQDDTYFLLQKLWKRWSYFIR